MWVHSGTAAVPAGSAAFPFRRKGKKKKRQRCSSAIPLPRVFRWPAAMHINVLRAEAGGVQSA